MVARKTSTSRALSLSPPIAPALPAATIGWVAGYAPERGVLVDFAGSEAGPVVARLLLMIDDATLQAAVKDRRPVALLFERGEPTLPLIVGLVQAQGPTHEARIDGKRLVITGEEEIELRCGEASITLQKNGKLVIRGTYVETRAKGTNRIKGGSVQIN